MASIDMKDDQQVCVLLTEGQNDCHVIGALCKHHNIQEGRFGFYECGCDDKVLKKANALLTGSNKKEVIGIVLDADKNLSGRWDSIQGKLSSHGYKFPKQPDKDGTILEAEGKPKLGVWVMPNNLDVGMLEDFCASLVPPEKLQIAKKVVEDVKGKDVATFKDVQQSKAEIHTYLAWQDEPGRPLGQSITSKVLQADTEIAQAFIAWLIKLFPVR